jgi:hypothetical protein
MTLTINIPPETVQRLRHEAARLGVDEGECAKRLIESGLPHDVPDVDQATLDLLVKWDKEDETSDPVEIARRTQEFEELKTALNQNRVETGGPHARKVFP